MNIKSTILLPDSNNKLPNSIVFKSDLVEQMYQTSKNSNFSGSNGISSAMRANTKSREYLRPFTTATTTAPFILTTSLPRQQSGFTTIMKNSCESGSKSPVNVSFMRSNSEPNRTSYVSDVSNFKGSNKIQSSFNGVNQNFSRQSSLPISNSSVITFTSAENVTSKSSKKLDSTETGLTIQRISKSTPHTNASYQNQSTIQCKKDLNRNRNTLEILCANVNNSSDSNGYLLKNKNHKNFVMNNGSPKNETNINSNNYEFISKRKSIKSEGKDYDNHIISSTNNGEFHNSFTTSISQEADSSSSRYHSVNPVISIIPVVPTINITTNGKTVSNEGNAISLYKNFKIHKEDQQLKQNLKVQQAMPNSVTITQLEPSLINAITKPNQSKLIYRSTSHTEGSIIVPPVMIVDPQESYHKVEPGTARCANPVTITPVCYGTPDSCMDDPHPLNLFSTVAANQEYLPTSTTTSSTTHDVTSYTTRSTYPKITNVEMNTVLQNGNHIGNNQIIPTSNNGMTFSEFMDHSDSQCLEPPPVGMQRRPKVSYKNLTEGEKNVRLRLLNNEASRLYRYRKQHTIKNLEVEEKQLQAVNSKLRLEFEALQLKRNEAMKLLHESLKRCRDCNSSEQNGTCPHRNIISSSNSAKVDTHTTKLIIKNQSQSETM